MLRRPGFQRPELVRQPEALAGAVSDPQQGIHGLELEFAGRDIGAYVSFGPIPTGSGLTLRKQ